jgi:putative ABC transport system permease protein
VEDDVPVVVAALPAEDRWSIVSGGELTLASAFGRPRQIEVSAVSAEWFAIKSMGIATGRAFTQQEDALGSPVIVIGEDLREHFFPSVDPIGRELRIGSIPYTVIGVAESQGSLFGISLDRFAVVPFGSPAHRLLNRFEAIDALMIQSPNDQAMLASMEAVRQTMRVRHRLRPSRADDFSLQTSDSALETWRTIQGYLVWAGVTLPTVGLIVGAIVIMNIMLVAVAERTHEIGIRKALGARRRDIRRQFLVESATLSTIGAMLGIAGGAGISRLVAAVSPLPTFVAPWSVFVAVAVGMVVGIISGVYPATRAARLDPIAALRQE